MWDRLTRVEAPAEDPVALADVKAALRVEHDEEDAYIQTLIKAAIARIDGKDGIGFCMMAQTWRMSLDRFPHAIRIPIAPVRAIAISYTAAGGSIVELAPSAYEFDLDAWPVVIRPPFGSAFPIGKITPGAVKVTLTLGAAQAGEVPAELKVAILLMVADWYGSREATTVNRVERPLPFSVTGILSAYRTGWVA